MVVRAVGAKGSLLARGWRSVVQLTCAQSGLEGLRSTDEPPGRRAFLPPRTCKRWQNPPCLPEDSLRSRSAARRLVAHQGFLRIIRKTNGCLGQTRCIAKINGGRGNVFWCGVRISRCAFKCFFAAEAAHKGPLFTPSLLNLLQGSPLGFWNSPPHVKETDKRERSVDGERTPKI